VIGVDVNIGLSWIGSDVLNPRDFPQVSLQSGIVRNVSGGTLRKMPSLHEFPTFRKLFDLGQGFFTSPANFARPMHLPANNHRDCWAGDQADSDCPPVAQCGSGTKSRHGSGAELSLDTFQILSQLRG